MYAGHHPIILSVHRVVIKHSEGKTKPTTTKNATKKCIVEPFCCDRLAARSLLLVEVLCVSMSEAIKNKGLLQNGRVSSSSIHNSRSAANGEPDTIYEYKYVREFFCTGLLRTLCLHTEVVYSRTRRQMCWGLAWHITRDPLIILANEAQQSIWLD